MPLGVRSRTRQARIGVAKHFPLEGSLHTDELGKDYGKIAARVVTNSPPFVRKAHLVDKKGISRTFAITFLPERFPNPAIRAIHEKIKGRKLIGETFRENGYTIRKNVLAVFVVKIPKWLQREFHLPDQTAKVRVSEFYAKRPGAKPVIYAEVAEIYSPDFKAPRINKFDRKQVNPPTEFLETEGFTKEQIWEKLGRGNDWSDARPRYEKAKARARLQQLYWRKKIIKSLTSG